jgi:hypothetical protein
MLKITIPESEYFDEAKQEFINLDAVTLELEHSLFSLSKWESKWEKPFLGSETKTTEQVMSYVEDMTVNPDIPSEVYDRLSNSNFEQINKYIEAKMSATWFSDRPKKPGQKEIITAEIIYYWMVALQIPFECQHWHLNRLFSLIKVCNEKNAPPSKSKMSRAEMITQRNELNARRRAEMKTSG